MTTPKQQHKPRRVKLFDLDWNYLLHGLQIYKLTNDFISIPILDFPEGSTVKHVFLSPERDAFTFVVENPQFPSVEEGMEPPRNFVKWEVHKIKKLKTK